MFSNLKKKNYCTIIIIVIIIIITESAEKNFVARFQLQEKCIYCVQFHPFPK